MASQFLPVLLTLGVTIGFSIGLLAFAALMSQRSRHETTSKRDTYESGLPLIDVSVKQISVKFYVLALVFVVLDVEVAFLYPWAVSYRELLASSSSVVFYDMLAFIALLGVAYIYLWRKGILDWGRQRGKASKGAR